METIDSLYYKHKNSRFLPIFFLLFVAIALGSATAISPSFGFWGIGILLGLFLVIIFLQAPELLLAGILFIYPTIHFYLWDLWRFEIFPGSYYEISLSGFLNIFIVLMTLFYCALNTKRVIRNASLFKPILFFIVLLLPSFLFSPYILISLRNLFRILMPISFYLIFAFRIKNEKQARRISNILIFSSLIPLFIGLWQIIPNSPSWLFPVEKIWAGTRRICGTFEHPNGFATFLNLLLLFAIFSYFKPGSRLNKGYTFFIIAAVICLFFTLTRIAWISFLCSGFVLFYFWKPKRKYLVPIAVVFAVFVLFVPGFTGAIGERMKMDSSARSRFRFAQYSLNKFKENPVFGSGFGIYSIVSKESLGKVSEQYGISGGHAPHNDYFKFLVETGCLGLLGYLVLLFSIAKLGFNIYRAQGSVKYWGGLLIATVSAVMIIGLTDAGFAYGGIYFWCIVAIVELQYRLEGEQSNIEKYPKDVVNTRLLR